MSKITGSPSLRTKLLEGKVRTRVQTGSAFSFAVESAQSSLSDLLPQGMDNFNCHYSKRMGRVEVQVLSFKSLNSSIKLEVQ